MSIRMLVAGACVVAPLADFCAPRRARCDRTARDADYMGCVRYATAQPACGARETCLVDKKRCAATGCEDPDADNDGENRIACGGMDCDDNDPGRAPGHTEVCDAEGLDEDCEITTVGNRDYDGDSTRGSNNPRGEVLSSYKARGQDSVVRPNIPSRISPS